MCACSCQQSGTEPEIVTARPGENKTRLSILLQVPSTGSLPTTEYKLGLGEWKRIPDFTQMNLSYHFRLILISCPENPTPDDPAAMNFRHLKHLKNTQKYLESTPVTSFPVTRFGYPNRVKQFFYKFCHFYLLLKRFIRDTDIFLFRFITFTQIKNVFLRHVMFCVLYLYYNDCLTIVVCIINWLEIRWRPQLFFCFSSFERQIVPDKTLLMHVGDEKRSSSSLWQYSNAMKNDNKFDFGS